MNLGRHPSIRRLAHPGPRRLSFTGLVVIAFLTLAAAVPAQSQAAACTPPVTNPVACENTLPGTPQSQWEITGSGDQSIQGFATSMSVNKGDTVSFKIKTPASSYHIEILRLGYYGGDGARMIAANVQPSASLPQSQPACLTDSSTGLIDCGNWGVSASWTVPSTATSGLYIAQLVRNDNGGKSHIMFVVRDEASHSDIVLQTSDADWEAYNTYGGNSVYQCNVACPPGNPLAYKGAFKVSYNRPFLTADAFSGKPWVYRAEYAMIRFLEANGYDLSYVSSVDVQSRGSLLQNHKAFISSGQDEYWSAGQRASVEAARDAGVNLAFFSGNEMYWKTRWEPSADGSATPNRTIVTYKDTHFDAPVDPVAWTGTWQDPRFSPPGDGGRPQNALTGQLFSVNTGPNESSTADMKVPSEYGKLRLWRNTAAASLPAGQSLTLAPRTVGFEWDEDVDNGFRPRGQFQLSSTTVSGAEVFSDYGSSTVFAPATHHLTMYRAASGALVFGAGTVQWSWGLDDYNPNGNAPDRNMQQATVNLFADMGAQPYGLLAGLQPAAQSTDASAPTSTLSPPPGTAADGAKITLSGTAADSGGGAVAGVEVSTDGGSTWHPATGTSTWSYVWVVHGAPLATVRTRAVDDSGNLETASAGTPVNVTCACSLWGDNIGPVTADAGDASPVEVGMKFTADVSGTVSGVRFYKSSANTGIHSGSLWTAGGQRLAQATFTSETASGWQKVTFATPVAIAADTTYVVSYYAPKGHYAGTRGYFYPAPAPGPKGGGIVDSPPLHAVRNSGAAVNGVYVYNSVSSFPNSTFDAGNYWVDVMFTPDAIPDAAGPVGNVSATAGPASATVSWTAPSTGGPPSSYKITPYIGATAQTPKTITGSPPATTATISGLTTGTAYTFTVQASNAGGAGPESAQSNAVTPTATTVPDAPTAVSATPETKSARVSWSAPAIDGGTPITKYTVTPYIGATAQTPTSVTGSPPATNATITGLTNGTSYTFTVTATNTAGTGAASAPSSAVSPLFSIFDFATPSVVDNADANGVELGVKFTADRDGLIAGIRFYKAATNTGTHSGSLWTTGGQRLAQATFTGESASGWQTVTFTTPVAVTANTTYLASYFAPNGHYSSSPAVFASAGADNPPLHALQNSTSANGVYAYGAASTFPNSTYNSTNYWVDVMFGDAPPPAAPGGVTNVSATAGPASATVSWTAPSTGGPPSSYKITPYIGATAQTPTTITGSPPATTATISGLTTGTAYTFTVQASNAGGAGPESAQSNAVTPTAPQQATPPGAPTAVSAKPDTKSARVSWSAPASDGGSAITKYTVTPYIGAAAQTPTSVTGSPPATNATITGLTNGTSYTFTVTATNTAGTGAASAASNAVSPLYSIFEFATPPVVDAGEGNAVELGVKFRSDRDGLASGIRFYKAATNTGTHSGSLWTTGGQRLAQATFTGESASGWQAVTFTTPVAVTAGTTYVASYYAPNGHYSVTSSGFSSSAVDNAPLHALQNSTSANGVYAYGAASTFPNSTYNSTNYWVDVLFADAPPPAAPGGVTNVSATAGIASATVSWTAPSTGGPTSSYKITPYIDATAQTPTTITGSPPATTATISGLTAGTAYTFTVQALNSGGAGPVSAQSNAVTPTAPPQATPPGAPTAVSAKPDTKSARVSWTAPASDGGGTITKYTVTPYIGATAQTPATVTGSPPVTNATITGLTNGTSYTFTVTATNTAGTGPASAASNAVTPLYSIFDFGTPAVVDNADNKAVELGLKFKSDVAGTVTGIRFYKAAANTGTHSGSLWSAAGTRLAQATFTGESASGWQTVTFATPVAITAGTTYVASYFAPKGHYSSTGAAFASAGADNAPLHALANSVSVNGLYRYSTTSIFPNASYNATNYWVDVLFASS